MATKQQKLSQKISSLATEPRGDKLMHAVVMTAGPGTRMLELTREGAARAGIKAWVDDEPVVWLTTDRSALMPVTPGTRIVTVEVTGKSGRDWEVFASKPDDVSGSTGGVLAGSRDEAEFGAIVP